MLPIGSIANAVAIIIGSLVGLALGQRLTPNMKLVVFQSLGLAVLVIGIQMGLKFQQPLFMVFSILIGGLIGELTHLDDVLNNLGERFKNRIGSQSDQFTAGFVTSSLFCCVGSMAILGSFDEGLRGDHTILLTKAVIDGFTAVALASTFGVGVLFSFLPVFAYQYSLTLCVGLFRGGLSPALINEMTAVGGLLILGIGFNLLQIKSIKVGNLLPSLPVVVALFKIFG